MNPQADLGADLQAGQADEHFQGVGDPAVGRVFERDDAELDVPAVDLLEHRGDRADRDVFHRLAELGHRREMAVAVLRPEAGDPEGPLQGPRPAHQFPKDQPEGFRRERAGTRREGLRVTSSSLAGDQTSSPCFCFTWPIWAAISARRFNRATMSLSSRSISPRRPARVGRRSASAGAGFVGRRGGGRGLAGHRSTRWVGTEPGRRPGPAGCRTTGRKHGRCKWIQKPLSDVKPIPPRHEAPPRSARQSIGVN